MKTKQRRKSSEPPPPPQPAWRRQPPPKRRPKVRQQQAVVTHMPLGRRTLSLRLPRVRLNWHYLAALPVLALLIFGATQLGTNERFFVYSAEIRGNQRVTAEEIYASSDVDGKNILWVRPVDVARKVQALPGIASASVQVWPPNRVIIHVQEQVPLAAWQVGEKVTWIAESGAVMPAVGAPPPLMLVDAKGAGAETEGEPVKSGGSTSSASTDSPQLRPAVLAALKILHQRLPEQTTVYYGREEGLYFVAASGWTVYLGEDGDIAGRLDLLAAAQPALTSEKVKPSSVDLRLDKRVIYR